MKRFILFLTLFFAVFSVTAQVKIKEKKYQSLLWEITGNGIKKPSYLIGTMHVSSKMAFHLPDSFYIAVRSAGVVALETNPETWQEDMNKYEFGNAYSPLIPGFGNTPSDYLSINTLKFFPYESKIEKALYSNPSTINNLLYRSYGNGSADFEEDTYLDMYIYQCGRKWGKKVTGVENYGESMKLMSEAYRDGARDKNKKEKSYEGSEDYSGEKLQEAYRNGNLDLLDSINKYNSESAAFDEKFLYKRNEIQANSIDSIIRSGSNLFVGVGAAHLPGNRGVIEMLRRKGYTLRPVKMGERDSRDKEIVDKIRVPVNFHTESPDDGFFKVDVPGKLYKNNDGQSMDQWQYADMANGSYYMVSRVMTNAWLFSHDEQKVLFKIDSLLYENVPGKILSKTSITKNGYKGFDIMNRTRRGDVQRYQIFVTPFEILFFKMSGNGDYAKSGAEPEKFFNSIQLKEYKPGAESAGSWKKFSPPGGGFQIELPHEPYTGNDGSWLYDAADKANDNQYRVIKTDIHNYQFAEEDSFDLGLLDESFMASDYMSSRLSRKQTQYKGYPALDCRYKDKNGGFYTVKFIIQGPHYYTLVARSKKESEQHTRFMQSFEIKPYMYGEAKWQRDTALYYSVRTPWYPEEKKIKLDFPRYTLGDEDENSESDQLEEGAYRYKTISNDSTGEKIYVKFFRFSRYYYAKDSSGFDRVEYSAENNDTSWIIRSKVYSEGPAGMKIWETVKSDSGSSRTIREKKFFTNGMGFTLTTESDTLSAPSPFISMFFDQFKPADTLKGQNPFEKKTELFAADFLSGDSVLRKRARNLIGVLDVDSTDLPILKKLVSSMSWQEKKYLENKEALLSLFGEIKTKESSDYLKQTYYQLGDTVTLQYVVLGALLRQKTNYSYGLFRDILNQDAPVLESGSSGYNGRFSEYTIYRNNSDYSDGNFMDQLSDSLALTRNILQDLLPLVSLDDYKESIMGLLSDMADSNLITTADYQAYIPRFVLEARQALKKQIIDEKKKAIEKAEDLKNDPEENTDTDEEDEGEGNDELELYARILMPVKETNPAVSTLINQMMQSGDKKLKFEVMSLHIRKNLAFPDSMINYFAAMDDYRYLLYKELKENGQLKKFPALYNNHLDLGKSKLISVFDYGRPDSIVYVDRLYAEYAGKKGYLYFFKYKNQKEDPSWKLASVGLVPEDPAAFEFESARIPAKLPFWMLRMSPEELVGKFNFTKFLDTKLTDEKPVGEQLSEAMRKLFYSRRKSARNFYEEDEQVNYRSLLHFD